MACATDDERRRIALECRERAYREEFTGEVVARTIGTFTSGTSRYDHDAWYRLADLIEPEEVAVKASDGHHTFDGLCDHRAERDRDAGASRELSRSRRGDAGREAPGWTSFGEGLPEPGAPVLCRGGNGRVYVGYPVTCGGGLSRKVWVPRCGGEYRSPASWMAVESPSCDREACGEAANGLPTRDAARTPCAVGKAQAGGAVRAAGAGARHEKN